MKALHAPARLSTVVKYCFAVAALALGAQASAAPLACSGSANITMTPVPASVSGGVARSAADLTCNVNGLAVIHVGGVLNSTMLVVAGSGKNARGYVEIQWLNGSNAQIGTWSTGDAAYIGRVRSEPLDLAVAVPSGAVQARIGLMTQSVSSSVGGTWAVAGLTAAEGVIVNVDSLNAKVAKLSESVTWKLSTVPDSATGTFLLSATDLDGNVIRSWSANKTGAGAVSVPVGPLPQAGYYDVAVEFSTASGQAPREVWPFVSLPNDDIQPDPRFGMVPAIWFLSSDLRMESLNMMRKAGVGMVREWIDWSDQSGYVFGDCATWMNNPGASWPDIIAQDYADAGMQTVMVFNSVPPCARYGRQTGQADAQPPLDYGAVFRFGQAYANNTGKKARNIEYWNEPNTTRYFPGYAWQYASGLKAFSAGVKSVDPGIRVLAGSAADNPNAGRQFFNEVWENGAARFVDTLNQHYYGGNPILPQTWGNNLAFYELGTLHADFIAPMLNAYGLNDYPSWITETGFVLYRDQTPGAPTEGSLLPAKLAQANHLVKAYAAPLGAGYAKSFYFVWNELWEEGSDYFPNDYFVWGLSSQNNPSPAYLSLALLARHLKDATPVLVQTKVLPLPLGAPTANVSTWTVFFRKSAGGYVAVSWAGGNAIRALRALNPGATITDVFGRPAAWADIPEDDQNVYLLSGIASLPASNVMDVPQRTRAIATGPQPLMLLVNKVLVNGQELITDADNDNHVPASWGSVVEVRTLARNGGNADIAAQVQCQGGDPRMVLLSAERPAPNADREYACRYRAQIADANYEGIRVGATMGAAQDFVHIPAKRLAAAGQPAAFPPPLSVSVATVTPSTDSAQIVFSNAATSAGTIRWLAVPVGAPASSIDAILGGGGGSGSVAIGARQEATAHITSLAPGASYTVYFFAEASPAASPYSTYTPLQTASVTTTTAANPNAAPIFTTAGPSLPGGVVGAAYSVAIGASGNPAPVFSWSGNLPPGLALDPATGVLSGTPTTEGTYDFSITATNSVGAATQNYTLVVTATAGNFGGPGPHDGIYRITNADGSPGDYVSIHGSGSNIIATLYRSASPERAAGFVLTDGPTSVATLYRWGSWDLYNGTLSGDNATLTGYAQYGLCSASVSISFAQNSTIRVAPTGLSDLAPAGAPASSCNPALGNWPTLTMQQQWVVPANAAHDGIYRITNPNGTPGDYVSVHTNAIGGLIATVYRSATATSAQGFALSDGGVNVATLRRWGSWDLYSGASGSQTPLAGYAQYGLCKATGALTFSGAGGTIRIAPDGPSEFAPAGAQPACSDGGAGTLTMQRQF